MVGGKEVVVAELMLTAGEEALLLTRFTSRVAVSSHKSTCKT